jgi:hypothetical protein
MLKSEVPHPARRTNSSPASGENQGCVQDSDSPFREPGQILFPADAVGGGGGGGGGGSAAVAVPAVATGFFKQGPPANFSDSLMSLAPG